MSFTLLIFTFHKLLYTQYKNFFLEFSLIPAFTLESQVSDLFYYGSHHCLSVIVFFYLKIPYGLNISHCPIIP